MALFRYFVIPLFRYLVIPLSRYPEISTFGVIPLSRYPVTTLFRHFAFSQITFLVPLQAG